MKTILHLPAPLVPTFPARRAVWLMAGLAAFFITAIPATAKRGAPPVVAPVVVGTVEYSAPGEFMGFVVATDTPTHKELWRACIYTVTINPALERDVQDNFIASLAVERGLLLIADERGAQYSLDPATRKVAKRE